MPMRSNLVYSKVESFFKAITKETRQLTLAKKITAEDFEFVLRYDLFAGISKYLAMMIEGTNT